MVTKNEEALRKFKLWSRITLAVVVVGLILLVIFERKNLESSVRDFIIWLRTAGAEGIIVCIVFYAIGCVVLFPGAIMTLGTGYALAAANGFALGLTLAITTVFLGATLGSIMAFLISRYIFREYFIRLALTNPRWYAIDKIAETDGFKITLLLRLCPAIPFNMLNYALGTTSTSLRDYTLATVGMIPGICLFCYFGASLDNLSDIFNGGTDSQKTTQIIFIIVGSVLAICGVWYVTTLAKRKLDENLEQLDLMQGEDNSSNAKTK